ncbi:MAG: LL-diaminopimelate aminotransferase [Clostridia bacterium]|nr:LL-diaminopimelate aminotransferase [Clostridia bacterium]
MAALNKNYINVSESYLFSDIAKRVNEFVKNNPDKKLIKMGIGDVTRPLVKEVVDALKTASEEMGDSATFRGYGPEQGYAFLRDKIAAYYAGYGVEISSDEIFVSDGAKSDVGNITDLFSNDNIIIIPDPVYPVYLDSNLMLGRNIKLIEGNERNEFMPVPYEGLKGDIIYLCSPNNPTGAVYDRARLEAWVKFALDSGAVILFDAAYECFIKDKSLPRSIYEIAGAKECAIEFCSLSKTAGFTGTRCGYTVIPKSLVRDGMSLNRMWLRRQTTKFNGVSYVVQKGAEAVFTIEGQKAVKENIEYYSGNAKLIADTLTELGIWFTGGINSPYIWLKCPDGMKSWEFFDKLLNEIAVVGTPGSGFGKCGEGYFRLTAFNTKENTAEAMRRLVGLLK